jgi:N-acetyl-anhydromuramyl-L-alanine amidase AmpD
MVLAGPGASSEAQEAQGSSLSDEFARAAEESGVPAEVLKAMGYVNTRWEMPPPDATPYEEGDPHGRGAYGIMQLQQNPSTDTLGEAAGLTGLTEEELKNDRAANVRGAAAVLAQMAGENRPQDLNGWFEVVAEYGGGPLYADQVFEVLKTGASATISTGETLELSPQPGAESQSVTAQAAASGQYPGSDWYGASSQNFSYASRPPTINKIVVHTMQGSFSSAINWFKDPAAGSSAHYNVRRDGYVGQSVREDDIAWHAGWWDTNETSIGIEHEGYISNPGYWYTDSMYRSSAKLTAYLAKKYRIPIDRSHIIGHNEVPGCSGTGGGAGCHTDPGSGWDWTRYMSLVRSYAGGTTATTTTDPPPPGPRRAYKRIVDNQTSGRFQASSRWSLNTWNDQRHWTNYRAATPGSTYDPARFKVEIPERGRYSVYAWWSANPDYSGRATFRIRTFNGVAYRAVDQRANGGRWIKLGAFKLRKGDRYSIELSNKSTSAGTIIADAVAVVKR